MEITIATWNIGGGKPLKNIESFSYKDEDYLDEDVAYFGSKLKELNPDIICLQETHIGSNKSLAKELGEVAGDYSLTEVALSESHIDGRYRLGNAILSKNKPLEENFHYFPYPSFPLARRDGGVTVIHEKGCQVLKFEFGNVANLHMQPLAFLGTKYDSPNGVIYAKEVEQTLEQNLTNPIVLCGDFNYIKSEELYSDLLNKLSLKSVLPDEPTRPDNKKTDYIFVSPEFTLVDSGIVKTNSDHYLCWARLRV
jgi:endonuclease/exonuclease/phosphatase family metal-dependent hydrolase